MLNITNFLFVMFVILQSKKDFYFLLVHLNLKNVFDFIHVDLWNHTQYHQFMVINIS